MTTQNSSSGKEPQGSLISNPHVTDSCQLLGQVLEQAAQGPNQPALEQLRDGALNLPRQPAPAPQHILS